MQEARFFFTISSKYSLKKLSIWNSKIVFKTIMIPYAKNKFLFHNF